MACKEINVTIGKKELNLAVEKTIINYSGDSTLLSLTDTPETYSGQSGKLLRVKSTEDGVEFTDSPTVVDWSEIGGDQSDVSLSGFTNDSGFISNLNSFTTDNLSEGSTNKYDKTVRINGGEGIEITGSYPEFTITNNQVSAIWGNITGTLTDQVDLKNALDLKYNSSSFNADWDSRLATKTTDNLTEGSTNKYDKTVGLTAGDGIQVTGTYPDFTITNISEGNTDHSALENLDYANSGHTGFQSTLTAGTNVDITNNIISATDTTYSAGDGIDITENVISNTGVLTESDPVFTSWDKSTGISITESQISDFGNYLTSETDPVWTSEKGNYQATSEKGQNNGYASLDAGGKVPVSELPNSIIEYKGTWNASTNSPTLIDGTGNAGDVYIVSVAGTQNLGSGDIIFAEGDWCMYNGTIWQKSINSNAVVSVNSQTGVVTLDADDIDDTSTTNKFVTSTDLTNLSNLSGINTGDQDLSGLVPYTGATSNVDLGSYDLTATDITSKGNLKILNDKYIQGRNYANSEELDILKVNTDDEVEAGADFNFGLLEFSTIIEPISPLPDSSVIYQESTGTTPNKVISLVIKNQLGEKIILSTLIV